MDLPFSSYPSPSGMSAELMSYPLAVFSLSPLCSPAYSLIERSTHLSKIVCAPTRCLSSTLISALCSFESIRLLIFCSMLNSCWISFFEFRVLFCSLIDSCLTALVSFVKVRIVSTGLSTSTRTGNQILIIEWVTRQTIVFVDRSAFDF